MNLKNFFQMKPVAIDTKLISACGLYCGACRKLLNGRCAGCSMAVDKPASGRPTPGYLSKCKIRRCCRSGGFKSCAECHMDVKQCKTYNTLLGKLFSFVFNTDRAGSIRYIREHGEEAYAEKMAWDETMAVKRKQRLA